MTDRLDQVSIVERIALLMQDEPTAVFASRLGISPERLSGAPANPVPDPIALGILSEKCSVSVEWLLRGEPNGHHRRAGAPAGEPRPQERKRLVPPPVNVVLQHEDLAATRAEIGHGILVSLVRSAIAGWVSASSNQSDDPVKEVAARVAALARRVLLPRRSYLNATGIIIHTGWGNAQLHEGASARLADSCAASPTGAAEALGRTETCEALLRALTGAEAATVTTMNAANLLLVGGVSHGREIVVAARDLVEISNGARVADILRAAGAKLAVVGSANCAYLADYAAAVSQNTTAILRIRVSNVAMTGYTRHVGGRELAELAHANQLLYVDNLGGGSLVDLTERGLPECPTLQQSLAEGADLVLASGDKIIGGPQAGIIVGKKSAVTAVTKHPFARTCRPSKLTLSALEGTLAVYVAGRAWQEIPALRMLATPVDQLSQRAVALHRSVSAAGMHSRVAEDVTECGGAVLPGVLLPTFTVRLNSVRLTEEQLYAALMARGVVARRGQGDVILDLRSVPEQQDSRLQWAITGSDQVLNHT